MLEAAPDASGRENLIGERVANIKRLHRETCRRRAEELNNIPKTLLLTVTTRAGLRRWASRRTRKTLVFNQISDLEPERM